MCPAIWLRQLTYSIAHAETFQFILNGLIGLEVNKMNARKRKTLSQVYLQYIYAVVHTTNVLLDYSHWSLPDPTWTKVTSQKIRREPPALATSLRKKLLNRRTNTRIVNAPYVEQQLTTTSLLPSRTPRTAPSAEATSWTFYEKQNRLKSCVVHFHPYLIHKHCIVSTTKLI